MRNENANTGKILIYQNEKGDTKIDVYFEADTIWMTQKNIAELYQTTPQNITLHIKNIYSEGELEEPATCKNYLQVQNEGERQVKREMKFYSFDMILAVGYRVRSNVGIHFRRWASEVLTEYAKKGFVLNDERLRNPKEFGADYFDELLERIRDIRASEKRLYQKVKDIFALSVDYDPKSEAAQNFFKSVQNKLEYAATGYTAPEIIASRANAPKDNMGLTSFKGAKVRRSDVTVAKNYMSQEEISTLNLIVNMYLDYAELMAKRFKEWRMMNKEIRERIETVRKGKVPEGYKKDKWQLFPKDWYEPSQLNTVLKENKERNENLDYGINDVLSVSGEFGVVNQVDLLGRSYAGESVAAYHIVYTDDIVYTKSPLKQNPHGIIKVNKEKPGIVSTLYAVYHCINPITAQYIEKYFSINTYLNNYLKPLVKRGAKNDMKVTNEDVLKGVIPLPSFEEQQKIVEILSRCDTVIEKCKKEVEEYKSLKKTCLSKMFPQNGSNVPEIRFKGFTGAWEQRRLGELAIFNPKEELPDVFEYVDLDSVVGTEMLAHRTEEKATAPSRAQRLAHTGDLFYQTVRPYQRNNYLFEKPDKQYVFSTGYAQLRPFVDGYFLLSLVQNGQFVKTVLDNCTGTSYPAINANSLAEIEVFSPKDEHEQKQIGDYFRNLDNLITLHQRKMKAYTQMRKALTQLLLTGIVRVNNQQEILP